MINNFDDAIEKIGLVQDLLRKLNEESMIKAVYGDDISEAFHIMSNINVYIEDNTNETDITYIERKLDEIENAVYELRSCL